LLFRDKQNATDNFSAASSDFHVPFSANDDDFRNNYTEGYRKAFEIQSLPSLSEEVVVVKRFQHMAGHMIRSRMEGTGS
jgi:hypothetical protein